MERVAIIGAGLSGLSAARRLSELGREVAVFEKSRSLGGRCASRLWNDCVFDHGAQFFTVRDADFRRFVAGLGDAVQSIVAPVVDQDGTVIGPGSERSYHVEGNNRLGRALAEGLDVRRESLIERVTEMQGGWGVLGERFDSVLSCAPWPQTAALLGIDVEANPYERNLTGAFLYDSGWAGRAREVYAVSDRSGSALAWSACENHKASRIPAGRTLFVVQTSAEFSRENWDGDRAAWSGSLRTELESRWGLDPERFVDSFSHRWGYSRRTEAPAVGELPPGFFVCGDSVAESRVEAVWLSGRQLAETMLG